MIAKTRYTLLLMVSTTALWLLPGCHQEKGPFKNGLYQSTEESYKQNFFLEVQGVHVTLYAWGINVNNDTVYYKATTQFEANNHLKFEDFSYSKQAFSSENLHAFHPTDNAELLIFGYTSFNNLSQTNGLIKLNGSMLAYDGRADNFEFELIE